MRSLLLTRLALLMTVVSFAAPAVGRELAFAQPLPSSEEVALPAGQLSELWEKPLAEIRLEIIPATRNVPPDRSVEFFPPDQPVPGGDSRGWVHRDFYWVAPNLAHQPIYFQNVPLERYGQSLCPLLQPVLSGAHFFATVPTIPYQMRLNRPYEMVYTLGQYTPGSPAPCVRQRLPWETDAALFETAVALGLIFALP